MICMIKAWYLFKARLGKFQFSQTRFSITLFFTLWNHTVGQSSRLSNDQFWHLTIEELQISLSHSLVHRIYVFFPNNHNITDLSVCGHLPCFKKCNFVKVPKRYIIPSNLALTVWRFRRQNLFDMVVTPDSLSQCCFIPSHNWSRNGTGNLLNCISSALIDHGSFQ